METIVEIKKRINRIILNAPFNKLMGFVNAYCKDEKPTEIKIGMEVDFVDWLTDWVFNASADVKAEFSMLDENDDNPLRICSVCGNFMYEGYITASLDYYCSDECRLEDHKKLTDGDEAAALRLIEEDFCDDSYDFYYTEW